MPDLTRKQKRNILIENYTRTITLLGSEGVCKCDEITYTYDGKNLVIIDINTELIGTDYKVNPVYDVWSVKNTSKIEKIKTLDLSSIKYIITTFTGCSLEVVIGNNIKTLPKECFTDCVRLRTVIFPNVINIGDSCFAGCARLEKVEFPRAVKVGAYCFLNSALKDISLGNVSLVSYTPIIHNLPHLSKLVFKSVRNLSEGTVNLYCADYLDLGYFYDSIYNFDFDPIENMKDMYHLTEEQIAFQTKFFKIMVENKLLTGDYLKYYIDRNCYCRNYNLKYLFSNAVMLKELHYKLPDSYKKLGTLVEEYYYKLFVSYVPETCKVIYDNG